MLLKKQNFSYLTAENYGEFLASPLCILLFFGILNFFAVLVSCGGFRLAFRIPVFLSEKKLYASDMLILGIKQSISFLRHSKISWIFCVALSAPFLTAYFIIREISYIRVLEFTARQIYKEVTPHILLYTVIGVILVISFFAGICAALLYFGKTEKPGRHLGGYQTA